MKTNYVQVHTTKAGAKHLKSYLYRRNILSSIISRSRSGEGRSQITIIVPSTMTSDQIIERVKIAMEGHSFSGLHAYSIGEDLPPGFEPVTIRGYND